MPDDPKAGTGGGESGAAAASDPSTASGGEQETAEQKAARLEVEKAELAKKYEDEHRLRLSHEEKVREANAMRRDDGRRDATDADPLVAEIAELQRAQAAFAAANHSDPATNSALRRAQAELEQRERTQATNERLAQARADIQSVPQELQARTWQLWQSGEYWTIAAAAKAADGENASKLREQLGARESDLKKREAEILARQAAAPGSPRAGGGGGGSGKPKMTLSEYVDKVNTLQQTDPAAARKLVREKDEGVFELDRSG